MICPAAPLSTEAPAGIAICAVVKLSLATFISSHACAFFRFRSLGLL
jgi:hypothetical protein